METKIIKILKKLNKETYEMIDLGLFQRVSDKERILYKIEFEIFGNSKIQDNIYKKYIKNKYNKK